MPYIILSCLLSYLGYCLTKDIKRFVLTYIALRSSFSVFRNVDVLPGIGILELLGLMFPAILLLYWVKSEFKYSPNKVTIIFTVTTLYVLVISLIKMIDYNLFTLHSFSLFLRWLNGFAVFITFPLIFSNREDVDKMMTAVLIYSVFPLLQFLAQLLIGPNVLGFSTGEQFGGHEMYGGLYGKYDVFANAVLLGSLAIIYKIKTTERSKENRQNTLYYFLFSLFCLMALSTLSRTLLVTTIVLTGVFLSTQIRRLSFSAAILAAIPLFFFSGFISRKYQETLLRSEGEFAIMRGEKSRTGLFHGRVDRWLQKAEMFDNYSLAERLTGTTVGVGPHGDYVNWMLKYGYIGLGLYLLLLFKIVLELFKSKYSAMSDYLRGFRIVVLTAIIVWILEAIIHNPSNYPDYMYAIFGGISLYFCMYRRELYFDSMRRKESFSGPLV